MGKGKCQWVMTSLLKFVVENDLKDLQERAENVFETWFGDRNLIRNERDLIRDLDSGVAKDLVSLCLPIERIPGAKPHYCPPVAAHPFTSKRCPILWRALSARIDEHLGHLSFNRVSADECVMFSHLVYSFVRQ